MNICNFRITIISIVFFLHGCTSAVVEPSVKKVNDNIYHGKHDLFAKLVKINGKYVFKNLTSEYKSKSEPWVRLNDLKPMFVTETEKDCYLGIGLATLGAKKDVEMCGSNDQKLFRVESGDSSQKIANGIMLIVTVGTTGTGRLTNIKFDRNQYEKAVSDALDNTIIDRKELIREHDDLWGEWEYTKRMYAEYKKNNINPYIKVKDKSGLYNKKEVDFSNFVAIQDRELTTPDNIFLLDNITSNTLVNVKKIKEELKGIWGKEQKSYLVTCKSGVKDGFNFKINCPIEIEKNKAKFLVDVTVLSKNIKRLIPNDFVGRDKNLEVQIFNGHIIVRNLTSTFLTLDSLSIYYIDKISTKTLLNLELPPQSEKDISISDFTYRLPNMSRTHYTSNDARKEIIKYGFAAKYTSSNKSIEKTLHKTKEYTGTELAAFLF